MSFKASMAGFLARLCKADRNMAENLQNPPRNTGALDIVRFTKKVRVKNWDIRGFKGVTINGSYPGRGHILMLPGGAYSLEPGKHHRRIAERFAILDHMKVSVFQYPLCPEYTAVDVRIILMEAYERLVSEYPDDLFFLFGDSSGGGLALAFLQELRDRGGCPMPLRTAVVSPWLDISLTNPKIKIARKTEHILPVEELMETGKRYCGGLDIEDPFVSPIYGTMDGLGPILMFSGEEEILTPDCELLTEKMEKVSGTEFVYRKAAGMCHDWILIPCRETDVTLDLIAGFFQEALEAE